MHAVVLLALLVTHAQTTQPTDPAATVSGRVTLSGTPARNVVVLLFALDSLEEDVVARTRTDSEGLYTFGGIAPGTYAVAARAIGSVSVGAGREGRVEVDVGPNDRVTGVDVALARGAVVTGRITNAEGRPIVGEFVILARIQPDGSAVTVRSQGEMTTDDRGIYRHFGLEPGRYLVSVGRAVGEGDPFGAAASEYDRTFHPNVRERAKATVVELAAGAEAVAVDIAVGETAARFAVSGRVVDAESGGPVAGAAVQYRHRQTNASGWSARTNEDGTFRAEGLSPGEYSFLGHSTREDQYCDEAVATISNADVSDVTILARRASAITGVVVVESDDPASRAELYSIPIVAESRGPDGSFTPTYAQSSVATDGQFRVVGLRPGSIVLRIPSYLAAIPLSLLRVERESAGVVESIPVGPGESVAGVRLVVAYGTGVVSGQVVVADGALPRGLELTATASTAASPLAAPLSRHASVDRHGRFRLEFLRPGTYTVSVFGEEEGSAGSASWSGTADVTVRVSNGMTTDVSITLARSEQDGENEP